MDVVWCGFIDRFCLLRPLCSKGADRRRRVECFYTEGSCNGRVVGLSISSLSVGRPSGGREERGMFGSITVAQRRLLCLFDGDGGGVER